MKNYTVLHKTLIKGQFRNKDDIVSLTDAEAASFLAGQLIERESVVEEKPDKDTKKKK